MARRLTTEQLIGALKEAKNHEERLDFLRNAGIGQLRKIGKIEMMAEFGRGWTVETLSVRILDQLERRYARIDSGKGVYGLGLFGMPGEIDTPLLRARKEKRERGEVLDEIVIESTTEAPNEEASEGEVTEIFEVGKTYKDKETGKELTIEKRTSRRIYCYVNGDKEYQYYRAPIESEGGHEYVLLADMKGAVMKFTATKEDKETSSGIEEKTAATETKEDARTMIEITEE